MLIVCEQNYKDSQSFNNLWEKASILKYILTWTIE